MRRVPAFLVVLRAVSGPVLIVATLVGAAGTLLAAVVTLAFVSDVLDGIVARRLGVATEALRRADSLADAGFYACAMVALVVRCPQAVTAQRAGIAVLLSLELVRWGLERVRYGRIAAYHMYSAKAWGVALWLGFSEVFMTGQPGPLFRAAVIIGILADAEGLAASLVLSRWQHDVPTLWHAFRLERGNHGAA